MEPFPGLSDPFVQGDLRIKIKFSPNPGDVKHISENINWPSFGIGDHNLFIGHLFNYTYQFIQRGSHATPKIEDSEAVFHLERLDQDRDDIFDMDIVSSNIAGA